MAVTGFVGRRPGNEPSLARGTSVGPLILSDPPFPDTAQGSAGRFVEKLLLTVRIERLTRIAAGNVVQIRQVIVP